MNEQPIVWMKTEAQKKRFKDHQASVFVSDDGKLRFESKNIITPKGLEKTNKLISVVPKASEKIVPLSSVPYLFGDLKQMTVILTNACNLSCKGCCHLSDYAHKGIVSYNEIKDWYSKWSHRLAPKSIDILGFDNDF
jgi:hypothetical protein